MAGKGKDKDFSQGGHEVLSVKGKVARWIISSILILYSFITIFVVGITLMDSLKTKGGFGVEFCWIAESAVIVQLCFRAV